MMTSHKDFPSDNLMCGPVVDDSVPGEFLPTIGALEITTCVILHYHVGITFYECSGTLFFVAVKQVGAFGAVHCDCVCFSHRSLLRMTL